MYQETITIFNRYHSRLGDIWLPHVLKATNLVVDKSSLMQKYGAETTDKAMLHVKYENVNGNICIDGIPYLEPKEWQNLVNEDLQKHITFNSDANYWDFFIQGEFEATEPINDRDFVDGFYSYMESKKECYVITSVSTPYKIIPHFEIVAR